MKNLALYTTLAVCVFAAACDVQSGITKKSVEKYAPTPTPEKKVVVEEPIDPADVVSVDTAAEGPKLSVNKPEEGKRVNCNKYNRVTVNGHNHEVNIVGACKQLMVNGLKNRITAAGVAEIVINGDENEVEYTKYVNGKKPLITDNGSGNTVTKAAPPEVK